MELTGLVGDHPKKPRVAGLSRRPSGSPKIPCRISHPRRMIWVMNEFTDRELLSAFAREGDEGAFAEVVRRYGGLVLGAALRRSGDHGLAEEAAQNVFTTMARKAAALAEHPALAAWLQKAAAYESARAMEKEQNRRRTMNAYQQEKSATGGNNDPPWQEALPLLDEAVAALPESDRQVLLLRYWQAQPRAAQHAAALGAPRSGIRSRMAGSICPRKGRRKSNMVSGGVFRKLRPAGQCRLAAAPHAAGKARRDYELRVVVVVARTAGGRRNVARTGRRYGHRSANHDPCVGSPRP